MDIASDGVKEADSVARGRRRGCADFYFGVYSGGREIYISHYDYVT